MGLCLQRLDRLDEALTCHGRAIELEADYLIAYNERGRIYLRLGRLDEAVADFDTLIELDPNYGEAYKNRALALCAAGDCERALSDANDAISMVEKYAEGYHARGQVWAELGRHRRAIADYQRAIEMYRQDDPALPVACYHLAVSYFRRGRARRALQAVRVAEDLGYSCDEAFLDELKEALPPGIFGQG